MKIESIQISAFGRFNGVELGPLSERVAIIHGPDEAGKSTIHAFIRAILFGFPPTDLQATRQVTASGRYGGRLIVRNEDRQRYTIERYLEQENGKAKVTGPDGEALGEDALSDLLAHVSTDLYESAFAFGVEDLVTRVPLSEEVSVGHMYATGIGVEHLPEILSDLRSQRQQLFDPNQRDGSILELLHALDAIEQALAVTRSGTDRYRELHRRRDEVSLDIRQIDYEIAAIDRVKQHIAEEEKLRETAREAEERAAERARQIEQHLASADSPPFAETKSPARLRREIDELRENWTRLLATRRMIDVYQKTNQRRKIPRSPWFLGLLMVGVLLPIVIGTITGHTMVLILSIASTTLGMVTLVLAAIARSRFESAQLQALLHLEMTHREAEGRFLHSALTTQINPANIDDELDRLESIYAEMLETAQPALSEEAREKLQEESRLAYSQTQATLTQRDIELNAVRAEWQSLADDLKLPDTVAGSPEPALHATHERRDALLVEREQIDDQLHDLETDRSKAELRFQREEVLTELNEQLAEWSTNNIAEVLIDEAVRSYGRSQQLQVLRFASDAFDSMTLGAYHRLIALDDGIAAIGRNGQQTSIADMSRGTREQAYLALRIGLIRTAGRHGQRLPVLIDDILVNFDPQRAVEAMRALDHLTHDHQLFIFTSHPSTGSLARFVIPNSSILALGEQRLSGLAPLWLDND